MYGLVVAPVVTYGVAVTLVVTCSVVVASVVFCSLEVLPVITCSLVVASVVMCSRLMVAPVVTRGVVSADAGVELEPHKKQLHISLAYQFRLLDKATLESQAEGKSHQPRLPVPTSGQSHARVTGER